MPILIQKIKIKNKNKTNIVPLFCLREHNHGGKSNRSSLKTNSNCREHTAPKVQQKGAYCQDADSLPKASIVFWEKLKKKKIGKNFVYQTLFDVAHLDILKAQVDNKVRTYDHPICQIKVSKNGIVAVNLDITLVVLAMSLSI